LRDFCRFSNFRITTTGTTISINTLASKEKKIHFKLHNNKNELMWPNILDIRRYRGAEAGRDHYLVYSKIKLANT
jgi:hypothetical protein